MYCHCACGIIEFIYSEIWGHTMFIRKDVLKLALPVIAEQAFIMVMGVINTIMAGNLGKEAVSAIGMVDSINNIFIAFFSALAVGGTVVVAQYYGQRNYGKANEAARHTVFAGILFSLFITVLLFIFRNNVVMLLFGSAERQVLENSLIYLEITLFTYPLIALTSVACGVLRGVGDSKTPMKVMIFMNFINIVLSYVFIYGLNIQNDHFNISIPGNGVKGAAYGIAAARVIGALLIGFVLLNGSKIIKLKLDRHFRPEWSMLKSIFGIGLPASIESLLFNSGKLITQIFIVGMGTASIAASAIASSVFGLINIPGSALSIAAITLVGQHMGKGESEEAQSTILYLTKATSLCMLVICLITFPSARLLASAFTTNADVIPIAVSLIRTSLLSVPLLWAVSFVIPAGLKGAGDAKYTLFVSIFGMWAFRVSLGYILGIPLGFGVVGVWFGMYIDWLVRGMFFYIRLKRGKWKNNIVIKEAG